MRRRKTPPYFETEPGFPAPLEISVKRKVRFEEVDPLNIVWHGRYPSYFEDARVAFGEKYHLEYFKDMFNNGFVAPIVQLHIDYINPLRFGEEFTIKAKLFYSEAVCLNFEYQITSDEGKIIANGYTVQLIMDLKYELMLICPPYLEEFRNKWKEKK